MSRDITTEQWLVAISISLATIHLILGWHVIRQSDQLVLYAIYWLAIIASFKRRLLRIESCRHWLSSTLGSLLILLLIYRSLILLLSESAFVRIFPSLAAMGIGLLAAGFKLYRFWKEGILIGILTLPPMLTNHALESLVGHRLQLTIAQLTTFLMHYVGLDVSRQGVNIILSHGAVSVEYDCTGGNLLILLWQLCALAILLLPIPHYHKLFMPLWSLGLILLLASFRVFIMALVAHQPALFEYWHGNQGNQIFSNIGILIFGCVCWWIADSNCVKAGNTLI